MENNNINRTVVMEEAHRCLLCYDAPCSKACPLKSNPSEFLKSLRFKNIQGALLHMKKGNMDCPNLCNGKKYCEKVCVRNKMNSPVQIEKVHQYLMTLVKEQTARKEESL